MMLCRTEQDVSEGHRGHRHGAEACSGRISFLWYAPGFRSEKMVLVLRRTQELFSWQNRDLCVKLDPVESAGSASAATGSTPRLATGARRLKKPQQGAALKRPAVHGAAHEEHVCHLAHPGCPQLSVTFTLFMTPITGMLWSFGGYIQSLGAVSSQ